MWLKEATVVMMDKNFPTTLIEMRVSIFFFYHIGLKVIQRQNRVFTFIGVVQTDGVDICNPQIILDACNANTSSFLKVNSIKKGR
jgi:hypothetical protein